MRAVISVIGTDRVGILAKISGACAKTNANVTSVSQSVLEEIFAMTMVIDITKMNCDIASFRSMLKEIGTELNLDVRVMHEDVFKSMHHV
jgi:ACT domain-containing protein